MVMVVYFGVYTIYFGNISHAIHIYYGRFTYIWLKCMVKLDKNSIHVPYIWVWSLSPGYLHVYCMIAAVL